MLIRFLTVRKHMPISSWLTKTVLSNSEDYISWIVNRIVIIYSLCSKFYLSRSIVVDFLESRKVQEAPYILRNQYFPVNSVQQ